MRSCLGLIIQQDLTKLSVVVRSDPGKKEIDLMTENTGHFVPNTELCSLKIRNED